MAIATFSEYESGPRPQEPPSRLVVVSVQMGLLLLAIYYTFVGGQTSLGVYDPTWRATTQVVSGALVACWLLWRWLDPRRISARPVDLPLLALLLAWSLATLFSTDPFRSQETMVFFVTYLFFFFMAVDLARHAWLLELTINALIGAAGLMWTLALLQIWWWYADQQAMPALLRDNGASLSLSTLPRLSVLGNPNTMAAYLVPIVPLILYKLTMSSKWISRLLLAIWGILVLVVLILTRSRGGLLGLAAALVYYGIALARQKTRNEQPSLKWLKVGALTLAAASSLLVYGVIVRYSRGVSLQDVPIQVRLETMAGALKILAAYPLLGSGPGTFGQELLRYQHPLREIHAHAHNLLLTFASETGWAGILCMVWLVGVTLRQWRPTDRETSALSQGSVRVALQAAWLGLVVHNLADSFFEIPAVILLMATLFGLWVGLVFQPRPLPRLWGRIVNLIASIVLVMTTAFGLRVTQGLAAYGRAAHATATGDWVAAAEHLKEAIKWSPQSRFYHRQLGFVHGYLALRLRSGQAAENPVYRSQAITQYKETLQVMDQFALDHANLSCLLWENGDPTQAIQEMTRARDLDPDNGLYRLNLGQYLEAQGNYNQAWDEYAWFLSHRPRHLHSSYWQQASPRKEHLPTILERAIEETITTEGADSLNLARLYTYAGYFSDALRVYDQWQGTNDDSTDAHIGRAEVWLAMGKLDQALTELEMAIALNPQAALAYHYRGGVYLKQNQLGEAAEDTEVALYLAPTPASYYQSGQIAQAQGDMQTAQQQYEAAIAQATSPYYTRYAVEVAKRPPFAEERLPCLVIPRITDDLVLPTLAEGSLLESEEHFAEAVQVYRRLLSYEPNEPRVRDRLERLCRQHQTSCQE